MAERNAAEGTLAEIAYRANLRYSTVEEAVTAALREAIITGVLKPGERLRQVPLAKELNASRVPVTAALHTLEAEGLVDYTPHRGAKVRVLASEELEETYQLRIVLETFALRLAIERISPADVDELADLAEQIDGMADPDQRRELTDRFYRRVYTAAHCPLTAAIVGRLRAGLGRYWTDIDNIQHRHSMYNEKQALLSLLRTELPVGSVANVGTSDVNLNIVSDLTGGEESNIRGGTHLGVCTAGFVLENSRGVRNISTAGHCPNNLTLTDVGGLSITLSFEDEYEGEWGDLQRHSVPSEHTLLEQIRRNSSGRSSRIILSVGVPMEGQKLWHYGEATGYKSDVVYRGVVNFNVLIKHLVAMTDHKTRYGDSGGPWFRGSVAHGIHMGAMTLDSIDRSLFTPAHHIDDAFPGWTVATV